MGLLKAIFKGLMSETGKAATDKTEEQNSYDKRKCENYTKDGNLKHNMEYFRTVLREEFPAYTVQENVSADSLGWFVANAYKTYGGVYPCRNYEFVIFNQDVPVVAILLTDHGRDAVALCKNTVATAKANGVPCLNFLMQFPNERSYVRERIASALL